MEKSIIIKKYVRNWKLRVIFLQTMQIQSVWFMAMKSMVQICFLIYVECSHLSSGIRTSKPCLEPEIFLESNLSTMESLTINLCMDQKLRVYWNIQSMKDE